MTAGEALEAARGLDFEKVWAMFQETDKQIKEFSKKADLRQEETSRQIKELSKKADLRHEEVARQQEETGRQIKEFSKKADLRQEEVARQQEETGKQIKELSRETDRQIKELSRNIGGLSSSLGRWAEEMISANLWEKFKALGFTFTHGGPEKYWENNRIVAQ
ncbi:MAG: hypothetical protein LBD96_01900, partial [Treponema sp.]|nr:hypothetical protein [Treponema sp.]